MPSLAGDVRKKSCPSLVSDVRKKQPCPSLADDARKKQSRTSLVSGERKKQSRTSLLGDARKKQSRTSLFDGVRKKSHPSLAGRREEELVHLGRAVGLRQSGARAICISDGKQLSGHLLLVSDL
jgi:hypothetical protein